MVPMIVVGGDNHNNKSTSQLEDLLGGSAAANKPPPYPSAAIQIVTWYMADSLSFRALVNLLTTQPQYKRLMTLEFVAPSGNDVSPEVVDTLCDWLSSSRNTRHLRRVTIYTVKNVPSRGKKGSLTNPRERRYLKQIEEACTSSSGQNAECSIKFVPTGDPTILCDSLTASPVDTAGCYRHLAIDGHLLEGIQHAEIQQLIFDLKWDKTIHVLLLKDLPPFLLASLLPPLIHAPILQTLKIINDPSNSNRRNLPDAPIVQSPGGWIEILSKDLLANRKGKLKTLQRLYLGYWKFSKTSTKILVADGLRKSKSIRHLELGLCQFDSGSGKYFQYLLQETQKRSITLKHIDFYFPMVGCSPTTTTKHDNTHNLENSDGYITFWKSDEADSSSNTSSYQSPKFHTSKPPIRKR